MVLWTQLGTHSAKTKVALVQYTHTHTHCRLWWMRLSGTVNGDGDGDGVGVGGRETDGKWKSLETYRVVKMTQGKAVYMIGKCNSQVPLDLNKNE